MLPSQSKVVGPIIGAELGAVSTAYLQSASTWAGVMSSATTLSADKISGLTMILTTNGLLLTHGGVKAFIPSSNVKLAILK